MRRLASDIESPFPGSSTPRLRAGQAFLALALAVSGPHAQDVPANPGGQGQKDLYYDTSPAGADTREDLHGFPMLIRLAGGDFPFDQAEPDGKDVRFSKADGTPVPFEIDRWDGMRRKAEIWIRADTVRAGHRGFLARMHWGSSAAGMASAPGGVYPRSEGYIGVWHLQGRHPDARPNSVPDGLAAIPYRYDSNEQVEGAIAYADRLDGGSDMEYLRTFEAMEEIEDEFTFSLWTYPEAAGPWDRLMDFGSGPGSGRLTLGRRGTSDDLEFKAYHVDGSVTEATAAGALSTGQWQHLAVSVAGGKARLFRNGEQVAEAGVQGLLGPARRDTNFIGRPGETDEGGFKGRLDEVRTEWTGRSPDWIRLLYENQRQDQRVVGFAPPCQPRFGVPADTVVPELGLLVLEGVAECADGWEWSAEVGPLRILDPAVKRLELAVPSLDKDHQVTFRFSARLGNQVREATVRVTLKDAIPGPLFTLPQSLDWNGRSPLLIRPEVKYPVAWLEAVSTVLMPAWSVQGHDIDTVWTAEGLVLESAEGSGQAEVSLCLYGAGEPICASTVVRLGLAARVREARGQVPAASWTAPAFTVDGRRAVEAAGRWRASWETSAGLSPPRP